MDPQLLERAATRFSQEPQFLGAQLQAHRAARAWSEAEQADYLGCNLETLHALALCFTARDGHDALELAERFGCRGARLARVCFPE